MFLNHLHRLHAGGRATLPAIDRVAFTLSMSTKAVPGTPLSKHACCKLKSLRPSSIFLNNVGIGGTMINFLVMHVQGLQVDLGPNIGQAALLRQLSALDFLRLPFLPSASNRWRESVPISSLSWLWNI
jgi:hypothetical protein